MRSVIKRARVCVMIPRDVSHGWQAEPVGRVLFEKVPQIHAKHRKHQRKMLSCPMQSNVSAELERAGQLLETHAHTHTHTYTHHARNFNIHVYTMMMNDDDDDDDDGGGEWWWVVGGG